MSSELLGAHRPIAGADRRLTATASEPARFAERSVVPFGNDRTGPIIGALVITLIIVLSVLRELLAPESGIADLLLGWGTQSRLMRPLELVVNMVGELIALTVLARVLDRRGWRPLWHVAAMAGLAIALGTLNALVLRAALHVTSPVARAFATGPLSGMQVYSLWLLAFRYPRVVANARLRSLEAERLQRSAELSRLREHLQPHFLRNTLNAIAAFVSEDPAAARNLLAALADLLSDGLEHDEPTQTLGEEIAWLRRYSEIFEARHRGVLRFAWQLDPAASLVRLPRLLLQPLVENAVRHGALARPDGGEVVVTTERTAAGVVVTVADDGPGFDSRRPEGLGLHLVRRRLAIECRDGRLRIESAASGTRAIVELA